MVLSTVATVFSGVAQGCYADPTSDGEPNYDEDGSVIPRDDDSGSPGTPSGESGGSGSTGGSGSGGGSSGGGSSGGGSGGGSGGSSGGGTGGGSGGGSGGGGGTTYPPLPPYVADTSPLASDYSIFDHGKECFDRFQVEIPSFDCDGPNSSRLKVELNGVEVTNYEPSQCDKPSLVGRNYACVPGARVTKFEETNKYGHKIATVVVCRRSQTSTLDSGKFDNIAVLQSDLSNNETCWYQIRKDASYIGRGIPSPYSPSRVKGDANDLKAKATYESPVTLTSDSSECYRCHDNHVWLRTPWIDLKNQVPGSGGKTNEIPRTEGEPTYLGKAYREWNLAASRPKQVKIDSAKFDAAYPPTGAEQTAMNAGKMAKSDACTQCHSVALSNLSSGGQGTCNHFARYWMASKPGSFANTVMGSKISSYGHSFPRNAWMPPTAATQFTNDADYQAYYRRSFKAIETCCGDPNRPGCSK